MPLDRGFQNQDTGAIRLEKGYFVKYDPVKRKKLGRYVFQYNPNSVSVAIGPAYNFNTAPVGSTAFAQYGYSEPVNISFSLFLEGHDTQENLRSLRSFVESDPTANYANPPMAKLLLGNSLVWLQRVPIGVVDSLDVDITRQDRRLNPLQATIKIKFIESRVSSLDAGKVRVYV